MEVGNVKLNFVVAEFRDDFGGRLLLAAAPAAPKIGASLRRAPDRGIGGAQARRARSVTGLALQHAILGVRLGPVHGLLDVLLHTKPLLVSHGDAALTPLVIERPFVWIAQGLFGFL